MLLKLTDIFGKTISYSFCVTVRAETEEDEEHLREELEDGLHYAALTIISLFVVEVYVYSSCHTMIKPFINSDRLLTFNKIYINTSRSNSLYFSGGYKDIYRRKTFFLG